MKNGLFLLCFCLALYLIPSALAQDYDKEKKEDLLRPGMERKKIGGITAIVPEGTEIYKKSGLFHMEAPEEYAARRFKEMEERMLEIDGTFLKMQSRIDSLALSIEELKKKIALGEPIEAAPEIEKDEKTPEETVDYYDDTDNIKAIY